MDEKVAVVVGVDEMSQGQVSAIRLLSYKFIYCTNMRNRNIIQKRYHVL